MRQPQTDSLAEYHVRRLRYLIAPALIVNIYYAVFLYYVYFFNFISRRGDVFEKPSMTGPLAFQITTLIVLLVVALFRPVFFSNAGATGTFVILTLATGLFILTITWPVYFWGGSHGSVFGPLLATVVGLTVIVAQTRTVRLIFGTLCVLLFIFLSIPTYHWVVFAVKAPISPDSTRTGVDLYTIFQTFAAVATIAIAFILTWKHAQEKTIFGADPALHALRKRATPQERIEMVQTSIKFAVDNGNIVLAGGRQVHSECIQRLDSELKEMENELQTQSETLKERDIWCGEWSPATNDIIPETLRSLSEVQASSKLTPDIEQEIKKVVKSFLAKEKSHWRDMLPWRSSKRGAKSSPTGSHTPNNP